MRALHPEPNGEYTGFDPGENYFDYNVLVYGEQQGTDLTVKPISINEGEMRI